MYKEVNGIPTSTILFALASHLKISNLISSPHSELDGDHYGAIWKAIFARASGRGLAALFMQMFGFLAKDQQMARKDLIREKIE